MHAGYRIRKTRPAKNGTFEGILFLIGQSGFCLLKNARIALLRGIDAHDILKNPKKTLGGPILLYDPGVHQLGIGHAGSPARAFELPFGSNGGMRDTMH